MRMDMCGLKRNECVKNVLKGVVYIDEREVK